ncbi:MAG: winged helix-turn-helix transcriptional regulator [Candidatus Heimdallarchaeota archaeon]|nr:MAG: winged helix-turn-helix transcriptional regulator [Candidatus Heimdallarchaeota archaeon]
MTDSETSSPQSKYQDVVNFKPVVLKVIDDEKTLRALIDPNYEKIIAILRKKPKTVQEITADFNKKAEMCHLTEPRTNKTIYRYLKTLEELGLVIPAGQRVVVGKTASENLYARTALIFQRGDIDWMSEEGSDWAHRFATILGYMLGISTQEASTECIQKFFKNWSETKLTILEGFAKTASDDILELITEGEWEELIHFTDWVYIFGTLIEEPKLLEELHDCLERPIDDINP